MNVKISRVDKNLPLPKFQTNGAVGFDLYCRENTSIAAHSIARIPMNIVVEVPKGYMLYLKDRSSTAMKKGLLATAGIVDQDYCGPNDEVLFQVYNTTSETVDVKKGERICQGIFLAIGRCVWQEVGSMENRDRGGFGSTGGMNEGT